MHYRFLYQDVSEPPPSVVAEAGFDAGSDVSWAQLLSVPVPPAAPRRQAKGSIDPTGLIPVLSDDENISWSDVMDDPYLGFRSREGPTGPGAQDLRYRRNWFPTFQPEIPSTYTLFDNFELDAWDSTQTTAAASNAAARANAPTGKGGGNSNGKGGGQKNKKYGEFAWLVGIAEPWGPGGSPPWGPDGVVPDEETFFFSSIVNQDFHRDRPLNLPMLSHGPWFFGDHLDQVDYLPGLSEPMRQRHKPIPLSMQMQREEQIEVLSIFWDVPFSRVLLGPPWIPKEPMESFINPSAGEEVTMDKWDNPFARVMPAADRDPLNPLSFMSFEATPPDENITIDKWFARADVMVPRRGIQYVTSGILDAYPIPDSPIVPEQIPYWTPLSTPVTILPVTPPRMGNDILDQGADETPLIFFSSQSDLMRLPPWKPKMPIALYPFRLEVESSDAETITVDKWYTPLGYNFRTLPDAPLPGIETLRDGGTDETVTLDKWYSSTVAYPPYLDFALRTVAGPAAQSNALTVLTAPWIRFASMDPEPIDDTPGVTAEYWYAAMSLPVDLFTDRDQRDQDFLRLYSPLEDFPIVSIVDPCVRPRRRAQLDTRVGTRKPSGGGTDAILRRRVQRDPTNREKPAPCDDEFMDET